MLFWFCVYRSRQGKPLIAAQKNEKLNSYFFYFTGRRLWRHNSATMTITKMADHSLKSGKYKKKAWLVHQFTRLTALDASMRKKDLILNFFFLFFRLTDCLKMPRESLDKHRIQKPLPYRKREFIHLFVGGVYKLSAMWGQIPLHRVGSALVDLSAQIPPSYDVALQSHSLVRLY